MASTSDLIETLADALGIEREVALDHARHLHQASGNFPIGDDAVQAEPEQAAALLISLMSGLPPAKAADALLLYGGLRLESARRGATRHDGLFVTGKIPDNDPFMDFLKTWGSTYSEFLTALIVWFVEASAVDFEVISFATGEGPGTAFATISYAALIEGEEVVGDVKFSLLPFGGGFLPDDAPASRLDRHAVVPGAILPVLREFFGGGADGPREVLISRADFARAIGGGTA